MPSVFIVPFVIAIDNHACMKYGIELEAVYNFSLQVGVKRFDVGVVFRGADVGV